MSIIGNFGKHITLQSVISPMNTDKSFLNHETSIIGSRTHNIGPISRQKFQNVEKLNTIVNQIQQAGNKQASPEQILELLKQKIKSNYNNMYDNYEANKNTILRTIQQTETSDVNELATRNRYNNVLLEDKLRAQILEKQSKLKKMIEHRDHIRGHLFSEGAKGLGQVLEEKVARARALEQERTVLEYEAAVLAEMKVKREQIKLTLKQRYDIDLKQDIAKHERTKKIKDTAHTKKLLLTRLEQKINQQEACELPLAMQEELQRKLEEYEDMHAHQNIALHEQRLSDEKAELERAIARKEQEIHRKMRERKQKQDKREHEIAYNYYLLKRNEEERLKRLFNVEDISQITKESLEEERAKLDSTKEHIEKEMEKLEAENEELNKDISRVITSMESDEGPSFLQLQKEVETEESQLRRIKAHVAKKQTFLAEWQGYIQMVLKGRAEKLSMLEQFRQSITKFQLLASQQPAAATAASVHEPRKFTKIRQVHEHQSSKYDTQVNDL